MHSGDATNLSSTSLAPVQTVGLPTVTPGATGDSAGNEKRSSFFVLRKMKTSIGSCKDKDIRGGRSCFQSEYS